MSISKTRYCWSCYVFFDARKIRTVQVFRDTTILLRDSSQLKHAFRIVSSKRIRAGDIEEPLLYIISEVLKMGSLSLSTSTVSLGLGNLELPSVHSNPPRSLQSHIP